MADCPEAASLIGVYMHAGCNMPCRVCTQVLPAIHEGVGSFRSPQRIFRNSKLAATEFLDKFDNVKRTELKYNYIDVFRRY